MPQTSGNSIKTPQENLADSSLEFVYHGLRLREGTDTAFDPEDRLATLEAIHHSPLKLVSLVEPIGPEHTNEEIADSFLTTMRYGAVVSGAMKRIAVKGTPLGELPEISEERLAQIVAVTRLAAGFNAPDICVHTPSELAIEWGANVVVVETGAIPRDTYYSTKGDWNGFSPDAAKKWFNSKGYHIASKW